MTDDEIRLLIAMAALTNGSLEEKIVLFDVLHKDVDDWIDGGMVSGQPDILGSVMLRATSCCSSPDGDNLTYARSLYWASVLCNDIAEYVALRLQQLFSVYVASYYGYHIGIHISSMMADAMRTSEEYTGYWPALPFAFLAMLRFVAGRFVGDRLVPLLHIPIPVAQAIYEYWVVPGASRGVQYRRAYEGYARPKIVQQWYDELSDEQQQLWRSCWEFSARFGPGGSEKLSGYIMLDKLYRAMLDNVVPGWSVDGQWPRPGLWEQPEYLFDHNRTNWEWRPDTNSHQWSITSTSGGTRIVWGNNTAGSGGNIQQFRVYSPALMIKGKP